MKCILLINLGASVGTGAIRRYIELFNHVSKTSNDILLILNIDLYNNLKKYNILNDTKEVIVLNIATKRKSTILKSHSIKNSIIPGNERINYLNNLKNFLGTYKYFFKLLIKWLQFSYYFLIITKKYKIDTIYSVFTGGIWVWPIAKLLNIRLIFSSNSYSFADTFTSKIKIFESDYWVLKYCDIIDFLSPAMVTTFESKIMVREKKHYSVSPNSFINLNNFYPVEPKEDWIVFTSRMEPHKNPLLLLRSIKILDLHYPSLMNNKIYLLGTGTLATEITNFIKSNNLYNVNFLGEVPNVHGIIQKSKIFISIQDGNNYPSQSLLEAMACGNAIIASDVGETRKLVTENEGILVPLNEEKIADAIQFLFDNPAECERLGKNARKKVLEEHNIEKYSKYFFEITKS